LPTWELASFAWFTFPRVKSIRARYNRWRVNLQSWERIRSDGRGYDIATVDSKEVVITGTLRADTSALLWDEIDTMIRALGEYNWLFYLARRDGGTSVCNATVVDVDIPEAHYNITFIPYEVTLSILDPFMYDIDLIEESWTGVVAPMSEVFTLSEWNEKPEPFIYVDCKSWTSITSISIELNGETITSTTSLTNGDSFLVNHKNKEVMKNGLQNLTFVWDFTKLKFGTNTLNISYTGTLNADVYLLYYPTYA
jgi:hypothetical protein